MKTTEPFVIKQLEEKLDQVYTAVYGFLAFLENAGLAKKVGTKAVDRGKGPTLYTIQEGFGPKVEKLVFDALKKNNKSEGKE